MSWYNEPDPSAWYYDLEVEPRSYDDPADQGDDWSSALDALDALLTRHRFADEFAWSEYDWTDVVTWYADDSASNAHLFIDEGAHLIHYGVDDFSLDYDYTDDQIPALKPIFAELRAIAEADLA